MQVDVIREETPTVLEPLAQAAEAFADAAREKFAEGDGHFFQLNYSDGLIVVAVEGDAAETLRPFLKTIPPRRD